MTDFSEKTLQEWLEAHLEDLVESIVNLESITQTVNERLAHFPKSNYAGPALVEASMRAALDEKMLYTLNALQEGSALTSLGCEFPLIDSPLPGRNPSADILALQSESG